MLALPVAAAYRKAGSGTEISVCAGDGIRRLALSWGLFTGEVDPDRDDFPRLFLPGASISRSLARILSGFDLVITTSVNPELRANLRNLGPMVLSPEKAEASSARHLQDVYRERLLLPDLGLESQGLETALSPPEAWISRGRELFKPEGPSRALIIHPGSGGRIKCWPLSRYLELANRVSRSGWSPAFLLGPVEKEMPEVAGTINSTRFPVLSDLSLTDTASVLAGAELYVGNDSGITHLAAVLGTPVIAIFGPSDPGRYGPRGKSVRIMYQGYECSPCHPRDREESLSECEKSQACLGEIKPEMVAKEIKEMLNAEC